MLDEITLTRPVPPVEEKAIPVIRAASHGSGPTSGGIEIRLAVDDLPTTFTLYARFGTMVTATVSPVFHPQP